MQKCNVPQIFIEVSLKLRSDSSFIRNYDSTKYKKYGSGTDSSKYEKYGCGTSISSWIAGPTARGLELQNLLEILIKGHAQFHQLKS